MKLTLENGNVIEGNLGELKEFLKDYNLKEEDDGAKYYSESKNQYLLISTMNDEHIKNAILKLMRAYLNDMKGASNEFFIKMYDKLIFGFDDDDVYKELHDLLDEINKRVEGDDVD